MNDIKANEPIKIGNKYVLVVEEKVIKVCNFSNNYYGDQQCYIVSKQ